MIMLYRSSPDGHTGFAADSICLLRCTPIHHHCYFPLALPMLRLLSPKSRWRKKFWKLQKPVMLVFIGKLSPSTFKWVPICQGFGHFTEFLHHFVLAKLATCSIRVKTRPPTTCDPVWSPLEAGAREADGDTPPAPPTPTRINNFPPLTRDSFFLHPLLIRHLFASRKKIVCLSHEIYHYSSISHAFK